MSEPGTARARRWQGSGRGETPPPLGVVLAGGLGRRIGGGKAVIELGGRPLISYPVEVMRQALGEVAVVAKLDSELPALPGVEVWIEPEAPRHPIVGLVHALELAGSRAVVVCAADMPFVGPELVRAIADGDPGSAPAVVASRDGSLQPLLGCYQPSAREPLARALSDPAPKLTEVVAAMQPRRYDVDDPDALFNVNSPDDLLVAVGMLDRRRARARPPRAAIRT